MEHLLLDAVSDMVGRAHVLLALAGVRETLHMLPNISSVLDGQAILALVVRIVIMSALLTRVNNKIIVVIGVEDLRVPQVVMIECAIVIVTRM